MQQTHLAWQSLHNKTGMLGNTPVAAFFKRNSQLKTHQNVQLDSDHRGEELPGLQAAYQATVLVQQGMHVVAADAPHAAKNYACMHSLCPKQ